MSTVNISIERFKELEEYESNFHSYISKGYLCAISYPWLHLKTDYLFATREEFKDILYEDMTKKIAILEEKIKHVPTHYPERIEDKKCWFCK